MTLTGRLLHGFSYLLLTLFALLLFVPLAWMVLSAFTPQSELQTETPMRRTFQALLFGSGETGGPDRPTPLTSFAEFKSWARTYLTTENFHSAESGNGLFDITAMPAADFASAPVHAWALPAAAAANNKSSVPAGRLILWFENTLMIALAVTALSVLLNCMAGYAFAKIPFPGSKAMFWSVIATIMIPGQVTVIPLFLLFTHGLGWYDSFLAVILPQAAAPVGIFLMKQYIQSLPTQLEDAARIDGCTEIGIFARVIVPLSKPILAVWAIFTFIGAWKAFLWPLIITDDQNMFMLEVGLKTLQFSAGPRNVGVVMSAALLASIPMAIIFFMFQKHLTKGLTVGAVKG